jgi:hypothetical protein
MHPSTSELIVQGKGGGNHHAPLVPVHITSMKMLPIYWCTPIYLGFRVYHQRPNPWFHSCPIIHPVTELPSLARTITEEGD